MANTWGKAPGPTGDRQSVARATLFGCVTLNKVSRGSTRWNTIGAGDTVTSITVGGTEILGSTITYATSIAATCKAAIKAINAYNSPYWAKFEGTDIIYIFPRDGSAADTGAVVATTAGFTSTDVNMNTSVAFVAATRWPSLNLGDDAFADAALYRLAFDFSNLKSNDSNWTLTSAEGAEIDITTEDQTLDVHIGPEGMQTLSATPAEKTFSVLAVTQGQLSMFLQSGAAQNPTFRLRVW